MQVPSLRWEDPLEEEMATSSSILACKIPWTAKPGRLQSLGSQKESDTTKHAPLIIAIIYNFINIDFLLNSVGSKVVKYKYTLKYNQMMTKMQKQEVK